MNPCSRTASCKTFAGAISKTANNGEINVLDSGGFGAITITKSITIDGAGPHASILAVGQNGVTINGAGNHGQPTQPVHQRRQLDDRKRNSHILQAAAVNIDNVNIMNFAGTGTNGRAITIETSTAAVRVNVSNSSIYNMGTTRSIRHRPRATDFGGR